MAFSREPRPGPEARRERVAADTYKSILENLAATVALIAAGGEIQYVNSYGKRVLGYNTDQVVGRNIFEFIHPDDAPRAALEYADTVDHEGERVPSVLRLRHASGTWVAFEIVANNRLKDPAIQAVIFSGRDLRFREDIKETLHRANSDAQKDAEARTTELAKINAALRIENRARSEAEAQLQNTISLLNASLDSTADGILVVSSEGRISSCNEKFREIWGLEYAVSSGEADENLLLRVAAQVQKPDEFLAKVRSLYADPAATSFDVLCLKDGRILERFSQAQRIGDKIVGRVWSFRDVTKSRQLEIELRQSQKMEALGTLAGGVAHDFSNLLMLISGYAQQAIESTSGEDARHACQQILATVHRAASVTKQLLVFSRKHAITPVLADLNVIVLDTEHMLSRLLPEQIELHITVAADVQPVYVDVSQIEVLIVNLATNARDAMPEGGRLAITTASGESDWAVLRVSDTGHGMTPEIQARIFDPFFTTKKSGKGTGLGLPNAAGIVKRAGGHIDVESKPNVGTTFTVYLPHAAALAPAPRTATPVSQPNRGDETILVVEDEAGIRAMTRAYLETLGYRVLEAADGAEAIRLSGEYGGTIHLLLTDLLMPGMRGDTAASSIQAQRPEIKVIFTSGHADQEASVTADDVLLKPFEFLELGQRIRSVLDRRGAAAASQSNLPAVS